jgi:hypothetical protein
VPSAVANLFIKFLFIANFAPLREIILTQKAQSSQS